MNDSIKYQAGDQAIIHDYYKKVLSTMSKSTQKCLNVGSGVALVFEKYLNEQRGHIDIIDCVDQNLPENKFIGGQTV